MSQREKQKIIITQQFLWRLPATSMLLNSVVHSQLSFNLAEFDIVDHSLFLEIISFCGFQTAHSLNFLYILLTSSFHFSQPVYPHISDLHTPRHPWAQPLYLFMSLYTLVPFVTSHSLMTLNTVCWWLPTCISILNISLNVPSVPQACILINISIWISIMYLKFNLSKTVLPIACCCEIHSTCRCALSVLAQARNLGASLCLSTFSISHIQSVGKSYLQNIPGPLLLLTTPLFPYWSKFTTPHRVYWSILPASHPASSSALSVFP